MMEHLNLRKYVSYCLNTTTLDRDTGHVSYVHTLKMHSWSPVRLDAYLVKIRNIFQIWKHDYELDFRTVKIVEILAWFYSNIFLN